MILKRQTDITYVWENNLKFGKCKLVGKHNQGYDVYILENIFILQANHSLFVL